MKKNQDPFILFLMFLFVSAATVSAQVVERHYYTNVYLNNNQTGPSVRKGDKFIAMNTCVNGYGNNYTQAPYLRETDTAGNEIWVSDRTSSDFSTFGDIELIDGDIFALFIGGHIGNDSSELWRVDESTGNIKWKIKFFSGSVTFCNFTANRLLCYYQNPSDNALGTIDKTTGKFLESHLTNGTFPARRLITLFNDGNNNIYAYDATIAKLDTVKLGDTLWTYRYTTDINASIYKMYADSAGNIYATVSEYNSPYLTKINTTKHVPYWQTFMQEDLYNPVSNVLSGKHFYILTSGASAFQLMVLKLRLDSGKIAWRIAPVADTSSRPDLKLGSIAVGSMAIDESGNVYTSGALIPDASQDWGNMSLIKFSGADGSVIFNKIIKSPIEGYNYTFGGGYIYAYSGHVFLIASSNTITAAQLADSVVNQNVVALFASVDGSTAAVDNWEEYNGPIRYPNAIQKILPLHNGKYAILMQDGNNTKVQVNEPSGKMDWATSFRYKSAMTIGVDAYDDICLLYTTATNYWTINLVKFDSTGNIKFQDNLSIPNNFDTLKLLDVLGTGPDFYVACFSKLWGSFLYRLNSANTANINYVTVYTPPRASIATVNNDTTVVSSTVENMVSRAYNNNNISPLPDYTNPVKGIRLCYKDSTVFYGGAELAASNWQMNTLTWRETVANNGFIYKILPAKGNYLYAVGVIPAKNDTTILALKFGTKDGKVVWSKSISSKYGRQTIYRDATSDTLQGRLFISGNAQVGNDPRVDAGALWVLNDAGNVIDTFYDAGSFSFSNSINSLMQLPNGDVLMAGLASYADALAGAIYRYHYTTYRILMGTVTENDKTTPLASSKVYAILFNASDSSLHVLDSTITDGKGSYLIKVADTLSNVYVKVAPTASAYPNQMPSYADSSLFFLKAAVIKMDKDTVVKDFSAKRGINPGGKGFISGLIAQGANKTGDPIAHLQLFLMNDTVPVTTAVTDITGNFAWGNTPAQVYKVFVDVPTINNLRAPVLTLPAADYHLSLKFLLHRNYLELVENSAIKEAETLESNNLRIYPNPFKDNFVIESDGKSTLSIEIYNPTGLLVRSILSKQSEPQTLIDLSSLPTGLYVVKINDGQQVLTDRIIKE